MDTVNSAKNISNFFKKELGFVNKAALEESYKKNELEVVGNGAGFVHFHHRKDGQTTIYSLAVKQQYQKKGWGRLLLFRVICSAIESGCNRIVAKCPTDLPSNNFYQSFGFYLKTVEPGKKRALNIWEYLIPTPFLFYCADGGTNKFGQIAIECGWKVGIRSDLIKNKQIYPWFIDNHWTNYQHNLHLESVKKIKPLLATACDIEKPEDVEKIKQQAQEISQYCGRVLLIPKVRFQVPENFAFWWGYSVPTSYGGTEIPFDWFGGRPTHLLGGSPKAQAECSKHLNVVSLDGNMALKLAQQFGKSIWQENAGVKIKSGCYESFRESLLQQFQWWERKRVWRWENEPLFHQLLLAKKINNL